MKQGHLAMGLDISMTKKSTSWNKEQRESSVIQYQLPKNLCLSLLKDREIFIAFFHSVLMAPDERKTLYCCSYKSFYVQYTPWLQHPHHSTHDITPGIHYIHVVVGGMAVQQILTSFPFPRQQSKLP